MSTRKMVKLFEKKSVDLDNRVKKDYINNGIATLPCRISSYDDIISTYSASGYETLNNEFVDYLKNAAEFASPKYPIVLNIIEECLTHQEREVIRETIRDTFDYELGMVEKKEKRHTKVFVFMIFTLIIFGVLLFFSHSLADEPRELFYIFFWFAGDTLCDYIFLTGFDLRHDRRMAGRLASVKVVFSKRYEKTAYTKSDVNKLYSEIEKDVYNSIKKD